MEKVKFTDLINNLVLTAKKDSWITRYDKEMDYFFWKREDISPDSRLVQVSHEASLYINPDKEVEGVFVEYLANNFVSHNPAYQGFVGEFNKKIDATIYTIGNEKEAEKYLFAFGESLRADIYQDAKEISGDKLDLDDLMQSVFVEK